MKKATVVEHVDSSVTISTDADASTVAAAPLTEDDDNDDQVTWISKKNKSKTHSWTIPYTTALPLLVMIDNLGVALVVPLLHSQYFQLAGVTSAAQRERLSSIYSASQIVGGLAMGALADSAILSRHAILLLSFLGSVFAYMMIQQGGLTAILVSRVTVGLVKQTMTTTSSIMAHETEEKERATHVGRLHSGVTVAWILGPSAGAYLFHNVGIYAPIYLSCSLFLVNSLLVLFCLPKETINNPHGHGKQDETKKGAPQQSSLSPISRLVFNFQACFYSDNACLTSAVFSLLLFQWVEKTTSYKFIATYFETRYRTEPYQRGYLQSYQSIWVFIVQSILVRPILQSLGGEVNAACAAALAMAVATFAELQVTFAQYLLLVCPLVAIGIGILRVSLKSIVSKVAPKQSMGSVFATIDVLSNAAQVSVPFYRTLLFSMTQPSDRSYDLGGDPDPYQWQIASCIHWLVAWVAFSCLLLQGNPCASTINVRAQTEKNEKNGGKLKTS